MHRILDKEPRVNNLTQMLIGYIGQISTLPLRQCAPATVAIFAAYLISRFSWQKLAAWDAGDWFSAFFTVAPFTVLIIFLGRIVDTSGKRGRLIVELEAAKRELELARQRDAELAALRERERLARDLHDNLGHSLVTLTVQLEAAQRLAPTDTDRATALLAQMQTLTRSSMEDLRRSLANLRAPGLGKRPLTKAMRTLCIEAERHSGATIECQLDESADGLPPLVAEVLWRVAQEGLTNVEKHAKAHRTLVHLALQPKEVLLLVSDDGVGVTPGADDKPGHFGVRGMRERIEGLGGTFTLRTNGNRGTLLEARVPVIA